MLLHRQHLTKPKVQPRCKKLEQCGQEEEGLRLILPTPSFSVEASESFQELSRGSEVALKGAMYLDGAYILGIM